MVSIWITVQSTSNNTYTSRIATGQYILVPSAETWPKLVAWQTIVTCGNTVAQQNTNTHSATTAINTITPAMNNSMSSRREQCGMPPAGIPGNNVIGGLAGMARTLIQNPSQLRSVLQHQMIRRMIKQKLILLILQWYSNHWRWYRKNLEIVKSSTIQMMSKNPEVRWSLTQNTYGAGTGGEMNHIDIVLLCWHAVA